MVAFTERRIPEVDGRIDALIDEILRQVRNGYGRYVFDDQRLRSEGERTAADPLPNLVITFKSARLFSTGALFVTAA